MVISCLQTLAPCNWYYLLHYYNQEPWSVSCFNSKLEVSGGWYCAAALAKMTSGFELIFAPFQFDMDNSTIGPGKTHNFFILRFVLTTENCQLILQLQWRWTLRSWMAMEVDWSLKRAIGVVYVSRMWFREVKMKYIIDRKPYQFLQLPRLSSSIRRQSIKILKGLKKLKFPSRKLIKRFSLFWNKLQIIKIFKLHVEFRHLWQIIYLLMSVVISGKLTK